MKRILMVLTIAAAMIGCGAQGFSNGSRFVAEPYQHDGRSSHEDPIEGLPGEGFSGSLDELTQACDHANAWQANQAHGYRVRPGFTVYCD